MFLCFRACIFFFILSVFQDKVSLCTLSSPGTQRSACLYLSSAGIRGVYFFNTYLPLLGQGTECQWGTAEGSMVSANG